MFELDQTFSSNILRHEKQILFFYSKWFEPSSISSLSSVIVLRHIKACFVA